MIKRLLVSVILLAFFALPGYAKASSISAVWFPVVSGSIPHAIALWFVTNQGGIGRITTTGKITLFHYHTFASVDGDIKSGPNNTIWYARDGGGLAFMTTSGKITVGTTPFGGGDYARVGNVMWFTDELRDLVGHTV